jgi:hypothetical protein
MNKYRIGLLAAVVVAGAGMLFTSAPVARADQPRMHSALRALENAERELAAADEDKGGHRTKALEHVRAAIAEVHEGIGYDRRH